MGNFRNFASFFVNPINKKYINDNYQKIPLCFVFQRLFLHLYPYPEKQNSETYTPEYLLKTIAKKNRIYYTKKRRNPNELISFILDNLHKELNTKKNTYNEIFNINNNRNKVIFYGIQNYVNSNSSIVFNLLNWFEIKEIKCSRCKTDTYHLNTYNIFELDILGAFNYKKNTINILDCLQYYNFYRKQTLFCGICHAYNEVYNHSKIYSSPNTFIFSLDRKNLDQCFLKIPFIITDRLNLSNLIENKDSPAKYQLSGVLSYFISENKYISFCLSPVDKQWYVYNDEKVEQTNINNIITMHNYGSKFIPCLLIYKSAI